MKTTIVGVYDDKTAAELVQKELIAAGIDTSDVRTVSPQDMRDGKTKSSYQSEDQSMGEKISDFFSSMFGADESDKIGSRYLEAVRRGSTLVVVDAESEQDIDRAEALLTSHNSVDIDRRGGQWRESGWSDYDENAPVLSDEEALQQRNLAAEGEQATLSETQEELKVGKTRTDAGKVKVFQRVSEEEVSESVDLQEQHATIRRRSVDRPVRSGDVNAFEEGSMEVQEFTEEPVVEKKARVTGEVDVGVERTEHTETVSDTVRSTDVEVKGADGRRREKDNA